jgi:hypothetical protein
MTFATIVLISIQAKLHILSVCNTHFVKRKKKNLLLSDASSYPERERMRRISYVLPAVPEPSFGTKLPRIVEVPRVQGRCKWICRHLGLMVLALCVHLECANPTPAGTKCPSMVSPPCGMIRGNASASGGYMRIASRITATKNGRSVVDSAVMSS